MCGQMHVIDVCTCAICLCVYVCIFIYMYMFTCICVCVCVCLSLCVVCTDACGRCTRVLCLCVLMCVCVSGGRDEGCLPLLLLPLFPHFVWYLL